MSFMRSNDNLPKPPSFLSHASSSILSPVVTRPVQGIGREGQALDMPGYMGTYTVRDGQPVPLGVVSDSYEVVQMRDLTDLAETAMMKALSPEHLGQVEIRDQSANNGSWVQRQYVIKAFSEALEYGNTTSSTLDIGTTVAATCSITTSFDGGTSTNLSLGSIDLVCQNGMVALNAIDFLKRRHTSGANAEFFRVWLKNLMPRFQEQVATMREWSGTSLTWSQIEDTVRALPSVSDKKAEKLLERAARECADRGFNVYALTSAFTFYSSHNSDEFPIRQTGNDNVSTTLSDRQVEVSRWVKSEPFRALLAA